MASMPEGSQQQLQIQVVQLQQRITDLEQEEQQLQAALTQQAALNAGLQAKLSDQQAASLQQQQQLSPVKEDQEVAAGMPIGGMAMKPIKTQRSVYANSPALLPSTPGSDKPRSRGAFYSSDGGGNSSSGGAAAGRGQHGSSSSNRKPSRLSSANGTAAASAAGQRPGSAAAATARQASRPGSAEPAAAAAAAEQHEGQHNGAAALAAESSVGAAAGNSKSGGVSYASQQWEENKQLQARIDNLRCATCCICLSVVEFPDVFDSAPGICCWRQLQQCSSCIMTPSTVSSLSASLTVHVPLVELWLK
jgi:hypothetical protein